MKRDIRDLFYEEEDLNTLPDNHRAEFLEKLKKQSKKKSNISYWLSAAAVVIIALTVGFNMFYDTPIKAEISPIVAQIEAVEAEYLQDIETEWESFIAITDDDDLVDRYRQKLKDLDNDYKEISSQFKADNNNIIVIESLVTNLQTRLKLLKDIQQHIKILNQKNEHNENTI